MFIKEMKRIVADQNATFTLYALKAKKSKMVATQVIIEDLADFTRNCLKYLIETDYENKDIKEYPHGIPKDHIETIAITNNIISSKYAELIDAIASPETNKTDLNQYNGYVIICNSNGKRTHFIKLKKLLKNYNNSSTFMSTNSNTYKKNNKTLLHLIYHFDCIISDNTCYVISLAAEQVFQLQKHYIRQTEECKNELLEANVIEKTDIATIDSYMKKPGKWRALSNFDSSKIAMFANVNPSNKADYEAKYHLPFITLADGTCRVDVSSEEKIAALIETITSKRGKDFDDRLVKTTVPFKTIN